MRWLITSLCLLFGLAPCASRADVLVYQLPHVDLTFQFQGDVKVDSRDTVSFRHPRFGTFYFGYDDVKFFKAPSTLSVANLKLRKAKEDPEACIEAARWCLHHGLLEQFYTAASAAWRLRRDHPTVQRLIRLKQKMDAPLPIAKTQEAQMQKYVLTGKDMVFVRSKHFLLMHNTKAEDAKRLKKSRRKQPTPAEQRLDLLEKVYESYLIKFYLDGLEIELPKEPLKVVLFAQRNDFLAFCEATDAQRAKAAGIYDKRSNIAVFYDQGTSEGFKGLDEVRSATSEQARMAMLRHSPATSQLVRYSKSLDLMTELLKLNQDIEVVTHECTHQMAANTGLMPNESATPVWVAEGIATYFESPKEAAWAGIGTVNESRLEDYRAMAGDTEHSNVEFIASDDIFMRAGSHESEVSAYGQAWALTHYLMAHHFNELMKYYKLLAERKPKGGKQFPPDENVDVFKKAFGEDLKVLNAEWRRYMKSLKTDVERITEGE
jgi:hypothetical protein